MLERFKGYSLEEAFREQFAVAHDSAAAKSLAKVARLKQHAPGTQIVKAGASDSDIYFILSGKVFVAIKGRQVAIRQAGQHFGEMAMIAKGDRRSASVVSLEETVTARVTEKDFTAVANKHPDLWRRLAVMLAGRLRERSELIRPMNEKVQIFIGSTSERLKVGAALRTALAKERWKIHFWPEQVFSPGQTPIESLVAMLEKLDFGLMVVTADDLTKSRGRSANTPRDNIVFELGLLTGALGRDRTFMVRIQGESKVRLPSDLAGVLPLEIQKGREGDLPKRIVPVVDRLREIIQNLGAR